MAILNIAAFAIILMSTLLCGNSAPIEQSNEQTDEILPYHCNVEVPSGSSDDLLKYLWADNVNNPINLQCPPPKVRI